MNALARIVADLTSSRRPSQADLEALSHPEREALRELVGFALSPRETAKVMADAEPMQNWLSAPKAAGFALSPQEVAKVMADAEPMQNWLSAPKAAGFALSPQEMAQVMADAEPMQNWLSAPKAARQAAG